MPRPTSASDRRQRRGAADRRRQHGIRPARRDDRLGRVRSGRTRRRRTRRGAARRADGEVSGRDRRAPMPCRAGRRSLAVKPPDAVAAAAAARDAGATRVLSIAAGVRIDTAPGCCGGGGGGGAGHAEHAGPRRSGRRSNRRRPDRWRGRHRVGHADPRVGRHRRGAPRAVARRVHGRRRIGAGVPVPGGRGADRRRRHRGDRTSRRRAGGPPTAASARRCCSTANSIPSGSAPR